ncbi:MAG: heavy-metal-associated domain-containing protein [Sphingomonadaceae bacterium]
MKNFRSLGWLTHIGLGIPRSTRQKGRVSGLTFKVRPWSLALMVGLCGLGAAVFAQIEGSDRTLAPLDSSTNLEVSGINVDIYAKSADAARFAGWREAQRRGWRMLWERTHGAGAPGLSDGQLDSIVGGIVVENEEIGPNRYVATLGVLFDKVRAGQILGVTGVATRSAPLLVIPVQWSGGTAQAYEAATEWRKAWARFRSGSSPIDYVRPSGTGSDPLLLTVAQTGRPGRRWWRQLLDQYGAADVLIPQVRLERSWPGGPVTGYFSARYGPDNRLLQSFSLRVETSSGVPAMLDEAIKRIDQIYGQALAVGQLRPDSSLIIETPVEPTDAAPADVLEQPVVEKPASDGDEPSTSPIDTPAPVAEDVKVSTFTVQFDTPDVSSVSSTESSVRGVPGVKSASTSSLALGGISVMRVSFEGDLDTLKLALSARGFSVKESGGTLRINRGGQ